MDSMTPRVTVPRVRVLLVLLLCAVCLQAASARAEQSSQTIDLIQVEGLIDPATAEYVSERLAVAQDDGVVAAVIQIDTIGALDIQVGRLLDDVRASTVPVIVWVAPRGARAPSAAVLIAYAADFFYVAEGTEIGPVMPVSMEQGWSREQASTASERATTALASLAEQNGRTVLGDAAADADDAVSRGVADGFASTHAELLEVVDGREVETVDGGTIRLETWNEGPTVRYRFQDMTIVQRLLHFATDPQIALFLLAVGVWGLTFELYHPGIGLAGIVGAASLLMSIYALYVLPTNWVGVALVVLAMLLMLVDLQTSGFGIWTLAGVVALITGTRLLFSEAAPELELSWWATVGAIVGTLVFFVSVMTAALRVRLRRPIDREEGIVGTIGEAKTDIAPEGTVLTAGTLWRARTMETGIAAGSKVKVMATEGLVLLVEPHHERADVPAD
jgi:membrane-bound serine protease (ClpP class)